MPTKSDRVAAMGTVSVPTRTSCAAMRSRSVCRKRMRLQAAAKSVTPSPMLWSVASRPAPVRPVMPVCRVSASTAIVFLRRRSAIDEPRGPQVAALARGESPEQAPVEVAARTGVPAEDTPQRRPHRQDAAVRGHQAVHERRDLAGGPPVDGVAAQHAEERIERPRVAGARVTLALVAPHDEQSVPTVEVEVAVLLIGGAVERPENERGADALAVAPAVEGRQAPHPVAFLAHPPIAKDHRPGGADGLVALALVARVRVGEHDT